MKAMRRTYLVLLSAMLLIFAGCKGSDGQQADGTKDQAMSQTLGTEVVTYPDISYEVDFHQLSQEKFQVYHNLHFYDESCFCRARQQGLYGISKVDVAGKVTDVIVPSQRADGTFDNLLTFCVTKNGEICALIADQKKDGDVTVTLGFAFVTYDKNGSEQSRIPIEEKLNEWELQESVMEADGNDHFVIGKSDVQIYGTNGTLMRKITLDEGMTVSDLCMASDGYLCVTLWNSSGKMQMTKLDIQKALMEKPEDTPVRCLGESAKEGELLAVTQEGLFGMKIADKTLVPILQWADYGIRGEMVIGVSSLGEGFLAFTRQAELIVLKTGGQDNAPEKKERTKIVLATLRKNMLQGLVADFNRSQSEYQVVFQEYGSAGDTTQLQESMNRMMADVLGSVPPDLIDMQYVMYGSLSPSLQEMLKNGYVEDLYPYLEKSAELSAEDIMQSILNACTYEGKLAAIPQKFTLQMLLVDGEKYVGEDGWTIEDMIAYDRSQPERDLLLESSAQAVLSVALKGGIDAFVDVDRREACFNGERFRHLMEYAASYPSGSDMISPNWTEEVIKYCDLSNMIDMERLQAEYYNGHGRLIGFPTADGKFVSSIMANSEAFAICSKGEDKEGAWKFIEFVLTRREEFLGATQLGTYGFPSNRRVLQEMEKLYHTNTAFDTIEMHYRDKDGMDQSYFLHRMTNEEIATFEKILENAQVTSRYDIDIRKIIFTECDPYFLGQKNLQDTINAIQGRATLYLKENE